MNTDYLQLLSERLLYLLKLIFEYTLLKKKINLKINSVSNNINTKLF